ncbi:CvpA family protein [Candidatus Pollutiaquabacter sp.]|uniref:CvpA family protein n=1 Tax=Candidatus Pollutiaquabacter sp. TaxID=3416354 RepID=UPI003CC1991E|nr:CvpA family protein [Bacteroidota bacterium]
MNLLDLLLALILLIGLVKGFINGFIYELAVVASFFWGSTGWRLADTVAPKVASMLDTSPTTTHYIAFFLVFLAVSVGDLLPAKLLEGLIGIAALGIFNKLLGALFGFGKYLLITSVALYFFHKADAKFHWLKADTKAESVLYYRVLKVAPALWK